MNAEQIVWVKVITLPAYMADIGHTDFHCCHRQTVCNI